MRSTTDQALPSTVGTSHTTLSSVAIAPLKYRFNVFIVPAPDLPGQWVAHCIELDLVTQGNTPEQASAMLIEAIALVAEERGFPPFEFRSVPAAEVRAYWRAPVWGHVDVEIHYRLDESHPDALPIFDGVSTAPALEQRAS